jgi:xanthine phosphoribosyltransferase
MPGELHKLVVIDEICDSGDTFKVIKQLFPMAKTATLFHREGAAFTADYHSYDIKSEAWLQFPWEVPNANS